MATYDLTAAGGTTGHPANGRTPFLVENTIDLSQIRADTGPDQNDVLQCIDIPAETLVMAGGIEVLTAASSSVTMDLGDGTTADIFVDGKDNSTGFSAVHGDVVSIGKIYGSAATLDVKILGAASSAGKIRVFAVLCDVSGVDETDRNTDSQQDTAV